MENKVCDICETEIELDISEPDEWREDDAGTYHEDCYITYTGREADYWKAIFNLAKRYGTAVGEDESLAYDKGDPKNPEYVNWVLARADSARKQ
jgi:hypothetical protein